MPELKMRKDRTPAVLRKLVKEETDARVARRLLAIANAHNSLSKLRSSSVSTRNSRISSPS